MTPTTLRSSAISSIQAPRTQNTAPVLEFRCLYTHDLRRKAKRWQDGNLKFHTFNKRIMVYDTSRNFIGDTYVSSGSGVDEGDELELEKHFALVQVSEPIGQTHTDLTELMQSRTKKPTLPEPIKLRGPSTHTGVAQKHRSLTTLLGTPNGPHGRATLPTTSPFEDRQKRKAQDIQASMKRRRVECSSPVPNDALPSTSTVAQPPRKVTKAGRNLDIPARVTTSEREVIDLCSQETSPVRTTTVKSLAPLPSPSERTKPIKPNRHPPSAKDRKAKHKIDVAHVADAHDPAAQPVHETYPDDSGDDSLKNRKPLKVIGNAPRKMLLCQIGRGSASKSRAPVTASSTVLEAPPEPQLAPHQQRLRDRLARIGQRASRKPLDFEERIPDIQDPPPPPQNPDAAALHVEPEDLLREPTPTLPLAEDRSKSSPPPVPPPLALAKVAPLRGESVPAVEDVALQRARSDPLAHDSGQVPTDKAKMSDSIKATTAPSPRPAPGPAARAKSTEPTVPRSVDPLDSGPWSREAFDLFDWWPPDRDKDGIKIVIGKGNA